MSPPTRPAREGDHPAVAELFLALETNEPAPSEARFVGEMMATTRVAEHDGRVSAYLFYQLIGETLYVRHVATAKERRREGAARALFRDTKELGRAAGAREICLNVKPDNTSAIRLYESEGLARAYASAAFRLHFSTFPVSSVRDPVTCPLAPELDAALEARFGLPGGQLAMARGLPNRVVLGATRDGAPVGVACFDRGFPGCFPFRADTAETAAALVEACRAVTASDEMGLVVEDAPQIEAWLESEGLTPHLRIEHYRGPLAP